MTTASITKQDQEFYQKNGYLLYKKPLFSQEKQDELTSIFEEQWELVGRKLNSELDTPHFRDERLLKFLLSDEVLDLVEPFIGPNIGLWSSHFICKEPFIGKQTPWHEDSAYWKGRLSRYDKIITVWLAIDRSNKENGCMRVIPGTHANGFSDYEEVDASENISLLRLKQSMSRKQCILNWNKGSPRFTIRELSMELRQIQVRIVAADIRCVISQQKLKSILIRTKDLKYGSHAEKILLEVIL